VKRTRWYRTHATRLVAASIGAFACLSTVTSARGTVALQAASAADYVFVDGFDPPFDCSPALVCAVPAAGKSCISGRLTDAASGEQLRAAFYPGKTCADGAAGGPCDLSIAVYDAVAYAGDPATAAPLTNSETTLDGCGRFRFANLDPPPSPYVAVAGDDAAGMPDLHVASATQHGLAANAHVDGLPVLAMRRDTVTTWTNSAGDPFGTSTFADVGAILFGFDVSAVPRAGVQVTSSGNPIAARDYDFADASASTRQMVDTALTVTGIDGAALVVGGTPFSSYSGTGAQPAGCVWPTVFATATPGVVFFVEMHASCP
jgi:hypothetical protein